MLYKIYKLYYKSEPKKVYIGVSKDIDGRIKSHLSEAKRINDTSKAIWINSHKGEQILVEILEEVDDENKFTREKFWIQKLSKKGFILTNSIHTSNKVKSELTVGKLLDKNHKLEQELTEIKKLVENLKTKENNVEVDDLLWKLDYFEKHIETLNSVNETLHGMCKMYYDRIVESSIPNEKTTWFSKFFNLK